MFPQDWKPKDGRLDEGQYWTGLAWRRRYAPRVARGRLPRAVRDERGWRPDQRCVRDVRQTVPRVRACSADAIHELCARASARAAPRLRVLSRSAWIDSRGDKVI